MWGQFKPLPQVLMELTPQQKQSLYKNVMASLGNMQWSDVDQLIALVMGNSILKQKVTDAVVGWVTQELKAKLK